MNLVNLESNVISLDDARKDRLIAPEFKGYMKYLKLLDIGQVINESKHLINQIRENPFNNDLATRSEILLGEVSKRAEDESPAIAESINEMKQILRDRMECFRLFD